MTAIRRLRKAALNVEKQLKKKKEECDGTSCSCNELSKAVYKFREEATPSMILHLLDLLDKAH